MELNSDEQGYHINYKQVIDQTHLFAVTRLLAANIVGSEYVHPGYFVRDLSRDDLDMLLENINPDDPGFENVLLVALMLTAGEGIDATDEQVHRSINSLIVMLTCESLRRKGLVKIHHQNFSFGEDAGNNLVIEKIEGIDYSQFTGPDDE